MASCVLLELHQMKKQKTKTDILKILQWKSSTTNTQIYVWLSKDKTKLRYNTIAFEMNAKETWH